MRSGCHQADITPGIGTPLSGFIARENKPSIRIDDHTFVRVLVLEEGGVYYFLVNYELLGLNSAGQDQIYTALEEQFKDLFSRGHCVLACTHTHSSAPTSPIEGESDPDPAYMKLLCQRTCEAAQKAVEQLAPAQLYMTSRRMEGFTFNRRAVLEDGRVSMAYEPDVPVVERGPLDETLNLMVWKNSADPQRTIAVIVNYACHGVALLTQAISGDIPGHIMRYFESKTGAPCLFLQGASGDVNPTTAAGERPALMEWLSHFNIRLDGILDQLEPVSDTPIQSKSMTLALNYLPFPPREVVEEKIKSLERIVRGEDSGLAPYAAMALVNSHRRVLKALDAPNPPEPCLLQMHAWKIGEVILVFTAAELFSVTARRMRALDPSRIVLPVAYTTPIVGYIPDAESMRKGGYEVDDAWLYYRQPAPFASDTEQRVVSAAGELIKSFK